MNTARPPDSALSDASAPEAAAAPVAVGLDALTAAAPAVGFETAVAPADVPETAVAEASLPETTTASVDLPEAAVAVGGMPEATAAVAAVAVPSGSAVSDFMTHRVVRALRERVRYRYVAPRVLREGESFRIQSPCCSRNVDPSGGLIDIALLTPGAAGAGGWSLSARDHLNSTWLVCLQGESLTTVLDALCVDGERQFWP